MHFWSIVLWFLALELVLGALLACGSQRFRNRGRALLGLASVQVLIPLTVYLLNALYYWIYPPPRTSDALGPDPIWSLIFTVPISLLLMLVGLSVIVNVIVRDISIRLQDELVQ